MRAEKAQGPQEPENRRRERAPGARPRRGAGSSTVGFGNVMRDVRGGRGGAGRGGAGAGGDTGAGTPGSGALGAPLAPGALSVGSAGYNPALAQAAQLDAGAQVVREMGGVPTATQLLDQASFGVQDATEALEAQDRSLTFQAQSATGAVPTPIVRMTPAALLETVLDEATKLELEQASKELHVELEPADLGPLIVELRRDARGQLDIRFRARQGDAARFLEAGTDLLRGRLADAGFPTATIDVVQDPDLTLTGGPPW